MTSRPMRWRCSRRSRAASSIPRRRSSGSARLPFRDLGFARVDTHRELRQQAPEAVLGRGQDPATRSRRSSRAMLDGGVGSVLVTRADADARAAVRARRRPTREEDARARARLDRPPVPAVCGRVDDRLRRDLGPPGRARGAGARRAARHARSRPRGRRRRRPSPPRPALDDLDAADCVIVVAGQDAALASRGRRPRRRAGDRRADEHRLRRRLRRRLRAARDAHLLRGRRRRRQHRRRLRRGDDRRAHRALGRRRA